ncbi:hypothetical protein TorRG33x02_220570 [Trema orientale]|uniref:Uncharacterized protein n=1 Tax=Trema orientale TaxID=63057 RepID=A0A2P5E9C1_TREOI|nr:hypothetical protein TorRG33x02_220570 [Trema orientale]
MVIWRGSYHSRSELAESPPVNQSELPIPIGKNLKEPLKCSILPLEFVSKIVVGDYQVYNRPAYKLSPGFHFSQSIYDFSDSSCFYILGPPIASAIIFIVQTTFGRKENGEEGKVLREKYRET